MSALAETIAAQGATLRGALGLDLDPALARLDGAGRVWLVGTGTSEHAALLGAQMLATAGLDARGCPAGAFAGSGRFRDGEAVIVISHTTETISARRCREEAIAAGARVLSITGAGQGWPEAIEASPAERSETYTASYLAALLVLAHLAVGWGETSGRARTWERSRRWSTRRSPSRP